jgi:outer membrane cobalamin receptor
MFLSRFVLVTLGLCLSMSARGAGADRIPDPDKAIRLPEIVIQGKPILEDTRLDSLGSPMSIINSRQIDEMNALDLPSALRRVPGVTISRYNLVGGYGGGDGGAIFLRGQGSGRPGAEIATLFDGVPRFAGVWIHPIMDALSLDGAQGIEIHKSPQPVLDGNMAFGSVNMVPRRREANGYETYLKGMVGKHDTRSGEIRHGGRAGRFD